MELNNKILKYGLILIALTLILTVGFTLVNRLEKPVFLKVYAEEYVYENQETYSLQYFELKYITNIGDNRRVIDVYFEETPNVSADVSYSPFSYRSFLSFNNRANYEIGDRYWIYSLNTIYLNIFIDSEEFDEIEIKKAVFTFNDGSNLEVDLGRIILYKDLKQEDLEHVSSRGSSDGTSSSTYTVKRDIKLMEVDSPIFEVIKDKIQITVGDYDYSQIEGVLFESGGRLNISSKFKVPDNIVEKYTYYRVHPNLYYENNKGDTSYVPIYNIHHFPHNFDGRGIFNYLKSRGEI